MGICEVHWIKWKWWKWWKLKNEKKGEIYGENVMEEIDDVLFWVCDLHDFGIDKDQRGVMKMHLSGLR